MKIVPPVTCPGGEDGPNLRLHRQHVIQTKESAERISGHANRKRYTEVPNIFPGKDYPDRAPFMAETGMKTRRTFPGMNTLFERQPGQTEGSAPPTETHDHEREIIKRPETSYLRTSFVL